MGLLIPVCVFNLQINFRCKPSFRESGSRNVREVRYALDAAYACPPFQCAYSPLGLFCGILSQFRPPPVFSGFNSFFEHLNLASCSLILLPEGWCCCL